MSEFPSIEERPNQTQMPAPPLQRRGLSPLLRLMLFLIFGIPALCCGTTCLLMGGIGALSVIAESNGVRERSTEIIDLGDIDSVNLEVNNEVGEISIRGDHDATEIEIEIIKKAKSLSKDSAQDAVNEIDVQIKQEGDRYIISVENNDQSANPWNNRSVDLFITVPQRLNLQVANNVGTLKVDGVVIADALNLSTEVGEIDFTGQIGPEGNHTITTNVGTVTVKVTGDSRFRADFRTDVGEIDLSQNLQALQHSKDGPGNIVTGNWGESPQATLKIITHVGAVKLRD